jgi:hypothetical protein
MMTFITQYEAEFEPLLNLRASGFKEIFRLLESLNKDYYSIYSFQFLFGERFKRKILSGYIH